MLMLEERELIMASRVNVETEVGGDGDDGNISLDVIGPLRPMPMGGGVGDTLWCGETACGLRAANPLMFDRPPLMKPVPIPPCGGECSDAD